VSRPQDRIDEGARGGALAFTIKLFVIVVVSFAFAYLAVANLVLWTGARRLVSQATDGRVSLDYGAAYSVFPGDLRFHRLVLSSRQRAPWSLSFHRATIELELGELLGRRVHVTRFEGQGLALEKGVLAQTSVVEAALSKAAPVQNASLLPGPAPLSGAEEGIPPWTIEVDRIDTEVRSIGVGRFAFAGDAHLDANLFARLQETAFMGPGRITVSSGTLSAAGRPMFELLRGHFEGRIDDFNPWAEGLDGARRQVSGYGEFTGRPVMTEILAASEQPLGQRGALRVEAQLAHGTLLPGSEAQATTGSLHLEGSNGRVSLQGSLRARVEEREDAGTHVGVSVDVPEFFAERKGRALGLRGALHGRLMLDDIEATEGRADIDQGTFTLHDAAVERSAGSSEVEGILTIDEGTISLDEGVTLRGSLEIGGADAAVLFDVLDASESLRWMFSLAQGQPFTLHADLLRRPGEIALSDLEATGGPMRARGALSNGPAGRSGAIRLDAGRMAAGVQFEGGAIEVTPMPPEGWLAEHLHAPEGQGP